MHHEGVPQGFFNGGLRPVSEEPWTVVGDYDTNRVIFVAFNVNWK